MLYSFTGLGSNDFFKRKEKSYTHTFIRILVLTALGVFADSVQPQLGLQRFVYVARNQNSHRCDLCLSLCVQHCNATLRL